MRASSPFYYVAFFLVLSKSSAFTLLKGSQRNLVSLSESGSSESDRGTSSANRANGGYKMNGYSTSGYNDKLEERGMLFQTLFGRRVPASDEDNEDGWGDMRKHSAWKQAIRLPVKAVKKLVSRPQKPGLLILIRHGQSEWNANKTFTGWADPDLSDLGQREVQHAARLLLEGGYDIDVVFTSRLTRAIRSAWIILQELDQVYLPVFKSWRLNERMYGALTGLSKQQTAEQLGSKIVQEWRGSLESKPPSLDARHPFWPGKDRKYADLTSEQIPLTESLLDCMERTSPIWEEKIKYELRQGRNVMVVAHANTLRGLVKTIDNISDDNIRGVAIPTGIPVIYKFDMDLNSVPPKGDRQTKSQVHMKGLFLEAPGLLKEALKREREWSAQIPGYNPTMERKAAISSLESSLFKLQAERELRDWAGQFVDPNTEQDDSGEDGNEGKPVQWEDQDDIWAKGLEEMSGESLFDPDDIEFQEGENVMDDEVDDATQVVANIVSSNLPCVTPLSSEYVLRGETDVPIRRDAVIVIIRHGKTEHNKLKLFTGWEDAPLAKEGVEEAREAGRLLKLHGFEFDVVYTSWLSRAIETAWQVIDEMDSLWLPIVKTWRLNERMYGKLTGLSKQMIKQKHGNEQFMAWRRGYSTPPPAVSSFSQHYPGNDPRYQKYLGDLRYSLSETIIRSIEKGRPTLHRKLPKSESLEDCMDRTVPFFTERIVPEAIGKGKRVLISSSENAIRGLLMHLCDIPQDKITGLEIPNGLPLIFDLGSKCVKLLDDGTGRDPLQVYNFGEAAPYLFRPCQDGEGNPDEECEITYVAPSSRGEPLKLSLDEQAALDAIKTRMNGGTLAGNQTTTVVR